MFSLPILALALLPLAMAAPSSDLTERTAGNVCKNYFKPSNIPAAKIGCKNLANEMLTRGTTGLHVYRQQLVKHLV